MSIKIGNNNTIVKSKITEKNGDSSNGLKSIVIAVSVSFVVGFIFLFGFWEDVVSWIEGLFG